MEQSGRRECAVPDSSPSEKLQFDCNSKTDDSDQVLTLLTNRPTGGPALCGRFRRGRAFHPALRNPPELRAELLIALAPLSRLFQNNTRANLPRAGDQQ